jgi:dTDP-4-dehydrorhamnose reductase
MLEDVRSMEGLGMWCFREGERQVVLHQYLPVVGQELAKVVAKIIEFSVFLGVEHAASAGACTICGLAH